MIFAFYKIRDKIINYKLIIIGEGELKNSLIKLTKDLQIEKRVIFLGWRNKLDKYYKKSKLFVLSSLYEGLGNVLIDAINYEVPIVTTNCKSGPSEIINNKKGGYLSSVSDSDELSKKILFALKYYNLSKKKILFAKKNIDRFLISKNSLKYLEYIEKVFYEKNKSLIYWSPFIDNVATIKATYNSVNSLNKYSKSFLDCKIIDVFGEWKNSKYFGLNKELFYSLQDIPGLNKFSSKGLLEAD